ncbi:MAG: RelA/SpoT family protein [Candidatus Doudnabacteria bacterium]|nr:RelA/SpoT family protein [bacterium]MDZ4244081.1 RelA/SpoT family protein [Candidatus Doudnabacteria bacterium]
MTYETVTKNLAKHYDANQLKAFARAYEFSAKAHEGQTRKSGDPYITHALAVADYLGNHLRMDMNTVIAGLLHDIPEDTSKTLVDIRKNFGNQVEFLVSGITKLGKIKLRDQHDEVYIETLMKMFLAMAADIRVVLIKLADRLHNLMTLQHLPKEKQERIARESLEVYAPIADRLGMGELKGQLEDLAFPFVYPKDYERLMGLIKDRYEEMKSYVERVKDIIGKDLKTAGIRIEDINGRTKHLYSLYQKLLRPKYDWDISKIYDLVALRIVVKNLEDCYASLGALHAKYLPLPGRIKDYIAFSKPNGYRSIHTTVFGPEKKVLEIQIKTREMHREAEYGIAAHWAYAEKGKPKEGFKVSHKKLEWVNQLRDWHKESGSSGSEFIESLKIDFFKNRIFVFTPKGAVKDLPEGATSLDFAFFVHSDLGLRATGAKINGKMAKLADELKNGDVVEILTAKEARVSRDWLRFVKTSNARGKIRSYLNKHQKGWLSGLLPDSLRFIKK